MPAHAHLTTMLAGVSKTAERLVLGRDDELAALGRFIADIPLGPSAVLLEGPAGIGKTTLWTEATAACERQGLRVLTARSSESEARMSYTGLADLFSLVVDETLGELPSPQQRALEAAILRTESLDATPDQRAVCLAVLGVVRSLAASEPFVIAIDDLQWLDTPSARVLSFVFRRLSHEPISIIATLRVGPGARGDPTDVERTVPSLVRLQVGPMDPDPLGRLMRDRTEADLPHPTIVRLHRAAHGNPLFALEIARAVVREGVRADQPGQPLPVPDDLQQLLAARLAALPSTASEPLLAIAATSQPTPDLVQSASATIEGAREGLAAAELAGVVERAGGRLRFSHPLLASTVYVNAATSERRAVHRRLAELVDDPEERARHLALAAPGPDDAVAHALDDAARFARGRAAPDAAAELAELARRLTPPQDVDGARRRTLEAAEYHFDAGDAIRAIELLREAIDAELPGRERAEMLFRLSSMSWMNLIVGVRAPAEQALVEANGDHEIGSGAEQSLAWVAFYLGDLDEAETQARRSAEDAAHVEDPAVKADALATVSFIAFVRGMPGSDGVGDAIALQDEMMAHGSWTEGSVYTTPRSILGLQRMWSGDLDDARDIFQRELAEYERHAMYTVRQEVQCYLAELECRAGRYELAVDLASEAMETVVESGQTSTQSHVALFNQALPAAFLGRANQARSWASEGVRLAVANDDAFNASWNRSVLGFLALSIGEPAEAWEHLEPVVHYLQRMGAAEPAIIPAIPDAIEALIALGRQGEAEPLIERLDEQSRALDRPWARACARRGRGVLLATSGDLEEAEHALEEAVEAHGRTTQPFDLARSLLALGQIQRRRKQKRPARVSLERAHGIFDTLGTPLWSARAEAELGRIGGRAPAPLELTPTERSVAALVGEGRTNREVADALFMSPSTVQAHLKRIYRKLGVRSRTELAAGIDRAGSS